MESSVHLTLVQFVLRHKLQSLAPQSVSFLVSDLLLSDFTPAVACRLSRVGSVALLNLVWMRSQRCNLSGTWSNARLLQTERHYHRWAFSETLTAAVEKGDLVLVQWTLRHFPTLPITENVVKKAAELGHLWLLQQLDTERPTRVVHWGKTSYLDAAKARHWDVVHWLLPRCQVSKSVKKQDVQLVFQAFDQNNLREFKWVLANGFTMKHLKLVDPPVHPKLRDIVEAKSLEQSSRGPTDTLEKQWRDRAMIIRYLVEHRVMPFNDIADISWRPAARYGDLEFLKWIAARSNSNQHRATNSSLVEALQAAADKGHLEVVKWLLSNFRGLVESKHVSEAIFFAADKGNLEMVRWLCETYSGDQRLKLFLKHDVYLSDDESESEDDELDFSDELDSDDDEDWYDRERENSAFGKLKPPIQATAMDVAAKNGHLEVLQFLQGINSTASTEQQRTEGGERGSGGKGSRSGGKRKKAKRQRERTPHCTPAAMDLAAAAGHLTVVQWLHTNRREGCTKAAMDQAAANGHLDVVKWLHFNRREGCTTRAIDSASARCIVQDPNVGSSSFATSEDQKRFGVIQFLHSNRSERCSSAAMDGAAGNGNLLLLKWLHTHVGPRCSPAAIDAAAGKGYLRIVKWLHENCNGGCTRKAMDQAAAGGHLEVVQWLHRHRGAGCTTEAIDCAAANGNFEVVKWLCENKCEGYTSRAVEEAALNGDLAMVKLLQAYPDFCVDAMDDDGFVDDLSDGVSDDSVKMAHNIALEEAAANGHLNVVQWLISNCENLHIVPAMEDPIINGHFEVLLCMHSALMGVYSAYDLDQVWEGLQEGTYPESNKEIVAWFAENYPRPAPEDMESELESELEDDMDEVEEAALLDAYLVAAFEQFFLR